MTSSIEVIDTQVHLPEIPTLPDHTPIGAAIAAMDAVGVSAIVIDEIVHGVFEGHGTTLPNGAIRINHDLSRSAVARFPQRFRYVFHADPRDPDLDGLLAEARRDPAMVGVRVTTRSVPHGMQGFADGLWNGLFAAAQRHGITVFCSLSRGPELLESPARAFPDLRLVLDHTGVDKPTDARQASDSQFDAVARLAKLPNVALKWSHAPELGGRDERFPFPTAMRFLLRALDTFGRERILYGSDCTSARGHHTWPESFLYIVASNELSAADKQWILGRAARKMLRWNAAAG